MSDEKKKKPHRVKARVSRGLRDLLPQQQLARQWMIDKIRGVYELYGFLPLSTPAVEYLDVLLGSDAGDEAQKSIFRVQNPEDEELGLRFDLTVPLARVVAQYGELGRPFRRYQVAPVWRGDKPDKGRYREFTQFDLDSVGVTVGDRRYRDPGRPLRHAGRARGRLLPGALLEPRPLERAARLRRHPAERTARTCSGCSTSSTRWASKRSASS